MARPNLLGNPRPPDDRFSHHKLNGLAPETAAGSAIRRNWPVLARTGMTRLLPLIGNTTIVSAIQDNPFARYQDLEQRGFVRSKVVSNSVAQEN